MSSAASIDEPMPDIRLSPSLWRAWSVVAILVATSFMTWFNRISMTVAYDERIRSETAISPTAMGWVYSAFLLAYTFCMTPGGWLIDRFGTWTALVVMGLGSALFGVLTAIGAHPWIITAGLIWPTFLLVRTLMGAVSAPVYPASSRVISQMLPFAQRGLANGFVQGAAALGIAATFPLFGRLIDCIDWPQAFLVSGSVTAAIALVWVLFGVGSPPRRRSPSQSESDSNARDPGPPLWRDRSLICLTLSYAAVGYMEYLFFHWVHYYFEDILELAKETSRYYAAIVTLAMAVGMVVGGWAADRLRKSFPTRRSYAVVPVAGMTFGAVLVIFGVLAEEPLWIVTWLALALAAVGATEAPFWTMAVELGGRRGGTAAGICNTGGNALGLVAPIVTPWVSGWITRQFGLSAQAGWQWGIGLGSVIALSGAVLWIWIVPRGESAGEVVR
jgi:MFS family permease